MNPGFQTLSGQSVDLIFPSPKDFRLADIATQLSRIPRFCGGTKSHWSVAAHSQLVEQLLPVGAKPIVHLRALLHDGHEFITGDIPSPVQAALRKRAGDDPLEQLKFRLQIALERAAGIALRHPDEVAREGETIREADAKALAVERRSLLVDRPWPQVVLPDISRIAHTCTSHGSVAEARAFRFRFTTLAKAAQVQPMRSFMEGLEDV